MDHRIEDILVSLIANVETLDDTLLSLCRSDLLSEGEKCQALVDNTREACISTLHTIMSVERKIQGQAFIMPDEEQPSTK
ncbi:MAG: hypothetical protein ACN2B6_06235 [Rickettsiales bacterium]